MDGLSFNILFTAYIIVNNSVQFNEIFQEMSDELTYLDKWEAINKVVNEDLKRNIYASCRGTQKEK